MTCQANSGSDGSDSGLDEITYRYLNCGLSRGKPDTELRHTPYVLLYGSHCFFSHAPMTNEIGVFFNQIPVPGTAYRVAVGTQAAHCHRRDNHGLGISKTKSRRSELEWSEWRRARARPGLHRPGNGLLVWGHLFGRIALANNLNSQIRHPIRDGFPRYDSVQ